jgi:hypothetical protein
MTRGLTAGQQHEISLRDLLSDVRWDQHVKRHYTWTVACDALTLIIVLVYLTSRYWRPYLPAIASRWMQRRTETQPEVPVPKLRRARPSVLSMIDEECTMRRSCLEVPARKSGRRGTPTLRHRWCHPYSRRWASREKR